MMPPLAKHPSQTTFKDSIFSMPMILFVLTNVLALSNGGANISYAKSEFLLL
jgi:hypothetical protein